MRWKHWMVVGGLLAAAAVVVVGFGLWSRGVPLKPPQSWQDLHDGIETSFIPLAFVAAALAAYFAYLIPIRLTAEQTLPLLLQRYNSPAMVEARMATLRSLELWYSNDRSVLLHFSVQNHRPPISWESVPNGVPHLIPTQLLNFAIELMVAYDSGFVTKKDLRRVFRDRYQWYVAYLKAISDALKAQHLISNFTRLDEFLAAQQRAKRSNDPRQMKLLRSIHFNWLNYLDRLIVLLALEDQAKMYGTNVPKGVFDEPPSDPAILRMVLSDEGNSVDFQGAALLGGSTEGPYGAPDDTGMIFTDKGFYRLYWRSATSEYFVYRLIVLPWSAYCTRVESVTREQARLIHRRLETIENGVIQGAFA